jgi:alpha-amylase
LRDKDGKPPGLIGWWPQRAVTFVDNHDTGGTGQAAGTDSGRMKDGSDFIGGGSYGQGHWRFPPEHRMLGYAYILTHPGVPCLFWPHAVRMPDGRHGDMAAEVATMVQMRKNAGIVADSPVEILIAESDVYVARVRGSNADVTVKLGPRYDFPKEIMPAEGGREWKMRASGEDYAIWSRPHPTRA